jgi:hypothetical protein
MTSSSHLSESGHLAASAATLTAAAGSTAGPTHRRRRRRSPSDRAIRLTLHLAAVAPFVVGTIIESARGWRPTVDDAVITLRSWDVLTSHSPLVGQHSNVTTISSHTVYGPGPLLYWFLTIPVHIDHNQGALWGAALLAMLGVVLAGEAAWSVAGRIGGAGVVVMVLLLAVAHPELILDPVWNPSVGFVWFLTTASAAWATACGRLRWTPLLVLAASIAIQCHLIFAVGALALVVIAPILALVRTRGPRAWGWLGGSLVVAAVCWSAPLAQQLTTSPGNLSLIASSGSSSRIGFAFGLKALAASASPHSLFFYSIARSGFHPAFGLIASQSPVSGAIVLVGLAAVGAGAWATRRYTLSTLAFISFVIAGSSVWTLSQIPPKLVFTIGYLGRGLWLSTLLIWAVALWVLGVALYAIGRRWQSSAAWLAPWGSLRHRLGKPIPVAMVVAALGTATFLGLWMGAKSRHSYWQSVVLYRDQADVAALRIERLVARGPVSVVAPDADAYVIPGVLWRLRADGWTPQISSSAVDDFGSGYRAKPDSPRVDLLVTHGANPALPR